MAVLRRVLETALYCDDLLTWARGGLSLYFRDPDGRSVELATPGTWPSY